MRSLTGSRSGTVARPGRRTAVTAVLAPLFLLTLVACGEDPEDPGIASANGGATPSASASNAASEEDPEKFADCMDKYGIEVKVESDGKGGGGVRIGGPNSKPIDEAKMKEAQEACKQYAPGGGEGSGEPIPKEDQEKFLKFAQCMRDHGIPMEDPKFEGGGVRLGIGGGKGQPRLADDKVQAAQQACQSNLPEPPEGAREGGPGGGPGSGSQGGGA